MTPGVWHHTETGACLVVYVDDLLLVAAPVHEARLWGELGQRVDFAADPAPMAKYLYGITLHDVM